MATLISCTIFRKIQGKLISLIKSPEAAAQLEEMKRLLDEALEQLPDHIVILSALQTNL